MSGYLGFAQHLAHGTSDDEGYVFSQSGNASFYAVQCAFNPVQAAFDLSQSSVDFFEPLLGSCPESQKAVVQIRDLLCQKSKRAFEVADTAFQVPDFRFDIHGHVSLLAENR